MRYCIQRLPSEEMEEDYPDMWVDTYAYQYTRSVPTKTKPRNNVMVRLCAIECDFSKPHSEDTSASKNASYLNGDAKTFADDVNAWSEICNNIFMYDYTCNFQHWALTFPDFHNLRRNFEYYAKNNTLGVMAEGNCRCPSAEMGALRAYLLSKILWNPYMSQQDYDLYMDDFLEGVYGPGGKYIRQYVELAEELTKDTCFSLGTDTDEMYPVLKITNHSEDELPEDLSAEKMRNYETTDWSKYWGWYTEVKENPITAEGEVLFRKARALAETDIQREQIDRIYTQVEYIKSYYYKKKMDTGKEALQKIVKRYFQIHSDEFSDAERTELQDIIVQYTNEQARLEYIQYNKELCEKFISRGITYLYAGMSFEEFLPKFDFSQPPVDWFERYWLNI